MAVGMRNTREAVIGATGNIVAVGIRGVIYATGGIKLGDHYRVGKAGGYCSAPAVFVRDFVVEDFFRRTG